MNHRITLDDLCEYDGAELKHVDFSKLRLGERQKPPRFKAGVKNRNRIRLMTRRETQDLAEVLRPLFSGLLTRSELPVLRRDFSLIKNPKPKASLSLLPAMASSVPAKSSRSNIRLTPLSKKVYGLKTDKKNFADLSSQPPEHHREIEIPPGIRYASIRTLKILLGAGSIDIVMKSVGGQWEICRDSDLVDFEDRSQIYKLRELTILS